MKYLERRLNFLFVKTASFYRKFIVIRLPSSMMEAMSMEKPIIAYNIREVRDLVEDSVNGFLVPFGDVNGLAKKILYLMKNPEVAKEMGKTGRVKIEQDFSLKVILPQMEKLYRETLETEEKEFGR